MNLNEAREIVVRNERENPGPYDRDEDYIARSKLMRAAIEWLDPTPISEDWLRETPQANVYIERVGTMDGTNYFVNKWRVKTLGELRTLLRVLGGGGCHG